MALDALTPQLRCRPLDRPPVVCGDRAMRGTIAVAAATGMICGALAGGGAALLAVSSAEKTAARAMKEAAAVDADRVLQDAIQRKSMDALADAMKALRVDVDRTRSEGVGFYCSANEDLSICERTIGGCARRVALGLAPCTGQGEAFCFAYKHSGGIVEHCTVSKRHCETARGFLLKGGTVDSALVCARVRASESLNDAYARHFGDP